MNAPLSARRIHITGVVQGVGFRPFVYNLALLHGLCGEVCNTSAGVEIVVEGSPDALGRFLHALSAEAPPLARINSVEVEEAAPNGFAAFSIRKSRARPGEFQPVSPDIALCPDCLRELFDPADRRYLYPFINCTNCGPRFTIIRDLPYDRPATTMAPFPLCPDCEREYHDPRDRRFHAQPVACPACGPQVWAVVSNRLSVIGDRSAAAILAARRLLREGAIVAVKGLGGFHLACDATNPAAVAELRQRKGRVGKPFALMLAGMDAVEAACEVSEAERALLTGIEKPIVLLARRAGAAIVPQVAPGVDTLGVMLPYTPLHHLLLDRRDPLLAAEPAPSALVMTSGNYAEEPIAIGNEEALTRLASLADAFLLHDREIYLRCDDSVISYQLSVISGRSALGSCQPAAGGQPSAANSQSAGDHDHLPLATYPSPHPPPPLYLRRSRGYAPYPVRLPFEAPPILAVGAELKNTFCLTRERYAFLSQHIGDMENAETLAAFEACVAHLSRLFRVEPATIAHDLHPDYLSTRAAHALAAAGGQALLPVQHHHAHIAAVMAEHGLDGAAPVIGVAFDGTGYGSDGAIWGGEFLIADYHGFRRAAHLETLPLPGGDAATRRPWRIALGYAAALGLEVDDLPFQRAADPRAAGVVRAMVAKGVNSPPTSSMGRLFDAVAALANLRTEVSYEAQAAIELEAAARRAPPAGQYPYRLETAQGVTRVRLTELLAGVISDARRDESAQVIGARFHATVAAFTVEVCCLLRAETGLRGVALSGGVWQNLTLLALTLEGLQARGFTAYTHRQVPPNDGGLALGQAAIAAQAQGAA